MTNFRYTARTVGILLLAAFLLYGIGSSLATTAAPGPLLNAGVGMILLNSLAVVAIGILMLPVLRPHSPAVAIGYLATRLFEGGLLAAGAVALLLGSAGANTLAYTIAMTGLGVGSLFLCVVLYRSTLVPRALAVLGFIGYSAFAIGSLLELVGVAGVGVLSAIPGGVFEVLLAIWLIARGFGSPAASLLQAVPLGPGLR